MKVSSVNGLQDLYPTTKFEPITPKITKLKENFIEHNLISEYQIKCPTGFGYTIGNAIRRTCLSSVPGSAIVAFKLEGALHIFDAVPGIKEVVQDISINLKQVNFKLESKYTTIQLNKKNDTADYMEIYSSDFENVEGVELINKDQLICTLDAGKEINLEVLVSQGIGYISADNHKFNIECKDLIPIDSIFSPVVKCGYEVRCFTGGKDEYDEIHINLISNRTKTNDEILNHVNYLLAKNFQSLGGEQASNEVEHTIVGGNCQKELLDKYKEHLIQDSDLSMRVKNKLLNADPIIRTVSELANMSEYELRGLGGLGDVCVNDIKRFLSERGLCFRASHERSAK